MIYYYYTTDNQDLLVKIFNNNRNRLEMSFINIQNYRASI